MSRQRDLLVNFERMWREMDELMGDPFSEARSRAIGSASAFVPRADGPARSKETFPEPTRLR